MSDILSFASAAASSPFLWPRAPALASPAAAPGPTVLSNWVLPGVLCVGGYPSAAEQTKAHLYAHAMAEARFDVYVNLMTQGELKRFRPYADLVTWKGSHLTPPLPQPEFLHFPIADGGVTKDEDGFIALIFELIQRMKAGRRIYLHCWGGHGRTGSIVSILLAVIDPTRSVDDALTACQSLHATREYNGSHLSPEPSQKPFVRRMVEVIRALPASYEPPTSFKLQHLQFTPYEGEDLSAVDFNDVRARSRARARLAQREVQRAGGGEGVIVVDSHGTASTTQAMNSVPSTPLMSPARRISKEIPPMEQGLLRREMLPIESHLSAVDVNTPPPFTVLQMNLLADTLCHAQSFPHTVAGALDWNARKHLLIDELIGSNRTNGFGAASSAPQIICVQECDHYEDWFKPELAKRGYGSSAFFKKHSVDSFDGVAIFIQDGSFIVQQQECITLAGMNQVVILMQLVPLDTGRLHPNEERRLYVVTSHLKAKEGFEAIRLKQVQLIMHHLQQFISKHHFSPLDADSSSASSSAHSNPPHSSLGFVFPSNAAVVFAGDLNDTPQSIMYGFLTSGSSDVDTEDVTRRKERPTPKDDASMDTSSTAAGYTTPRAGDTKNNVVHAIPAPPIRHPFWLHSLYNRFYDPTDDANHPGPLYTTVKHRDVLVQRCIDYVFYTPQTLQPTAMLSIPNVDTQLASYLPALNYPSDHLAIAGRFEWK
jgi:mRNA deadenylase 3'-5' endonuclease subunit Ccr4